MFRKTHAKLIAKYLYDNGCYVYRIGHYDLSEDDLAKGLSDKEYFSKLDEEFERGFASE